MRHSFKYNLLLYHGLFSGLGVFSFLLLMHFSDLPGKAEIAFNSVWTCLFFVIACNILGYVTIRISSWLDGHYIQDGNRSWRLALYYMLVMLMFLMLNYGVLVMAKLLVGAQHPFVLPKKGVHILIVVCLVELVIVGLLLAFRSARNMLLLQKKAALLQEENDKARYTALQNQLNPHFLFNSLNTLIAEIAYDPQNAIHFTRNLSDVYRYVLQSQNRRLVTLEEELDFLHAYLFLHEVRLGGCITCKEDIANDDRERLLPPLTLQLLIENVIKHNAISSSLPMVICISTENGWLMVWNLLHPKKSENTPGIGLKNLSNRCRLTSGKDICVDRRGDIFVVKVPFADE